MVRCLTTSSIAPPRLSPQAPSGCRPTVRRFASATSTFARSQPPRPKLLSTNSDTNAATAWPGSHPKIRGRTAGEAVPRPYNASARQLEFARPSRSFSKHGDVIVCATTACLRARLRTAPIRSRERQRADAQLLMTFCLAPGKVIIPRMADGSVQLLAAAFRAVGIEAEVTPPSDAHTLELGACYTSGDECFPAKVTLGDFLKVLKHPGNDPAGIVLFLPLADGPCRYGQYAPYLRSVLNKSGYRQVRILSPNCDDGYASLGRLAKPFFRTAWRAAVAGDILTKCLLMTRPYELKRGAADEAYRKAVANLSRVIATAPLSPGPQLRAIRNELTACRDRFRGVGVGLRTGRPLIGIVGEIFCRMNSFSNQDLIRRLEEYGAEAWLAGFGEWVWYADAEELRILALRGRRLSWRSWMARLRWSIQRRD